MKKWMTILAVLAILLGCYLTHLIDHMTLISRNNATISMSRFSLYLYSAVNNERDLAKHPNATQVRRTVVDALEKTQIALISARPIFTYYGITNARSVESIIGHLLEEPSPTNQAVMQYLGNVAPEVTKFYHIPSPTIQNIKQLVDQLFNTYMQSHKTQYGI